MSDRYKKVLLLIPKAWTDLIDKAKEDMNRNEWVRMVIRDALIEKGLLPQVET